MSDGAILITPEFLLKASKHVDGRIDEALVIGNQYLSTQVNAMGSKTWSGGGTDASHLVAMQVQSDLSKVLHGGKRLAHGLFQAAVIMAAGEDDAQRDFQQLVDQYFPNGAPQAV